MAFFSIILNISVASTLLAFVAGCGSSEQSTSRTSTYGTTHDGDRSAPGNSSKSATEDKTESSGTSGLAGYLFTLQQAKDVSPLVETFKASSDSEHAADADASLNEERDFIASYLDDVMNLEAHNPGRDFTVVVSSDDTPNASALNQSLVINKGIITFASNLSLAMVICHEVAHSSRNHSSKSETYLKQYETEHKSEADTLDNAIDQLIASRYDANKQTFTHTKTDYNKIKPIWDAFWTDFVDYQKRFESEADVVGGRICADAGFSSTEVVNGFVTLFDSFKGLTAETVDEGTYTVPEDDLAEFLHKIYTDDTHPTDAERRDQINRIKDAFVQGGSTALATRWKNDFPNQSNGSSFTKGAALTGLSRAALPKTIADKIIVRRIQATIDQQH